MLNRHCSIERSEAMSNSEAELVLGNVAPSVATGSVFGAMALITGTSVGAGILALPAITAPLVRLSLLDSL